LVTAQVKQKWWGHLARIEYVACIGGGDADDVFASASYDATVRLWDSRSKSKDPLMILEDAKDAVTCVSSVPGEAQIITSSVDGKVCPKSIVAVDYEESVISYRCLFVQIRTYDLRTAQLITQNIGHPITSFSFGFDSTTYAASCLDGSIRLVDYQTNRADRRKVWQHMNSLHKAGNYKLECAFTSDDKYVISGSECGALVAYPVQDPVSSTSPRQSTEESKGVKLQKHTAPTCSVAACPQSSRPWLALSASYDGSALVWASHNESERCLDE
jgi:mitogen-activated protein kinase organizer 1